MTKALAILFCLFASPALAEEVDMSGNRFLSECQDAFEDTENSLTGECVGLVEGFMYLGVGLRPDLRFCPPVEAAVEQGLRIVIIYMQRHPEQLHRPFAKLAWEALREAWPCPSERN